MGPLLFLKHLARTLSHTCKGGARAVLSPPEEVALRSVTDVKRTSGFCLGTTVEHPLCTRRKGCRKTFPFFEHVVLIPARF